MAKKFVTAVLCLCMLFGMIACNNIGLGDTPPDTSPDTQPIDTPTGQKEMPQFLPLAQYTIVYPQNASQTLKDTAKRLQDSINACMNGNKIPVIHRISKLNINLNISIIITPG